MSFRLLLFFFITLSIFGQNNQKQVYFRNLTVNNGLSQNSVVSIVQDSIGYLWFATQDGLNKYDGKTFAYYNKQYQDVTRDNYAHLGQLTTDNYGDFWSYNSNQIIEKYNYKTQEFDSIVGLKNATKIFRKNKSSLWVGTLNSGLYEVDLNLKKIKPLFQNELGILSVFEIKSIDDVIYLGTDKGLYCINNNELNSISNTEEFPVSSIVGYNKSLVFGTYGKGVHSINLNTKKVEIELSSLFPDNLNIQDILLDSKSRLWIATYGKGLYLIDNNVRPKNFIAKKDDPFALHYNDILKIYEDSTGTIWFGSDGGGLSYYDEHLIKFNTITSKQVPDGIHVDVIRAITVDANNAIWLGTSGKGLTMIDRKNELYKTFTTNNSGLKSNRIMSLLYEDDKLWIGHQNQGLQIRNTNGAFSEILELQGKAIWKIYKDSNGYYWFCTRTSGLIKYHLKTGEFKKFNSKSSALTTDNIRTVEEDKNKSLWIGTEDQGLFKLNLKNDSIYKIVSIQDKIKALHFRDSVLWIGTNGNGIKNINVHNNDITSFNFDYGLPNKVVYALLSDNQNNLWVSTNKGISRFSPNHPKKQYVENYSPINGLQAYEFNTGAYFKDNNGLLYFGGIEGFNWFDPNQITYNEVKPKTVISKFEVFGKEQQIINDQEFSHDQNTMTFTFSGLHFSHPDRNLYRYKLVNHDEDWTKPDYNSVAHYTNLPPNYYVMMALSSNYEGKWNKEPTLFSFSIKKPWYGTNLAWTIYSLLLLSAILLIYRYFKFRWQMQTQLQLEHAETERLKKLDEFKTKLYTNISHEFRTPLTLITGPIDKQLERDDITDGERNDLSLVKQNAERLISLANQMTDLSLIDSGQLQLRVKQGNLSVLLQQIVAAFKYKALDRSISINASIDKIDDVYFDRDIIEKVISNLLNNAIKYAPSNSDIQCSASKQNDSFIFSIINDYEDIGVKDLSKLFKRFYQDDEATEGIGVGLALVKELIGLSKGNIIANTIDDNKIQFNITLPVNKSAFSPNDIVKIDNSNSEFGVDTTEAKKDLQYSIVIVEDQPDILDFVSSIFSKSYNVIKANNGKQGLKAIKKHLPDVVISDIMMPGINGVELCNRIKENELTSHIPVILLTAKVGQENEIIGLTSGADAYITKPFNSKRLIVEVRRLIDNRRKLKELFSNEFSINPELAITSTETEFLNRLKYVLDKHITDPDFKSESFSNLLSVSRTQLHRKLKSLYGLSTSEFIRSQRLKLSQKLLKESDATIAEIGYQVGFNSSSYFIKSFKEVYNMTPNEFQNTLN